MPLHYSDFESDDPALWTGKVKFVLDTDNIDEVSDAIVEGGIRFEEEFYSARDQNKLVHGALPSLPANSP